MPVILYIIHVKNPLQCYLCHAWLKKTYASHYIHYSYRWSLAMIATKVRSAWLKKTYASHSIHYSCRESLAMIATKVCSGWLKKTYASHSIHYSCWQSLAMLASMKFILLNQSRYLNVISFKQYNSTLCKLTSKCYESQATKFHPV